MKSFLCKFLFTCIVLEVKMPNARFLSRQMKLKNSFDALNEFLVAEALYRLYDFLHSFQWDSERGTLCGLRAGGPYFRRISFNEPIRKGPYCCGCKTAEVTYHGRRLGLYARALALKSQNQAADIPISQFKQVKESDSIQKKEVRTALIVSRG